MTDESLENIKVGDHIVFQEERNKYTVRAKNERYFVCTKPFNARKTVLYTIVDRIEQIRGTENLVFGLGAETYRQCREMIDRLAGKDLDRLQTEISHRNRIPLKIKEVIHAK